MVIIRYFHGGVPDLKVGDFIIPANESGSASTADFGAERVCRKDRIYLTSSFEAAFIFGSMHPSNRGTVYEVEPVGELKHDIDCDLPGLSFEVERAKIIKVFKIDSQTRRKVQGYFLTSVFSGGIRE
jgi:hypothetical protein